MMALSAIGLTVKTRIAAALPLESVTLFDGSDAAEKVIEEALNSRGVAVFVYPIARLVRDANQSGFVRVRAEVVVRMEINPDANSKSASVVPDTALVSIISAVLTPAADPNDTQFSLAENAAMFDDSDPGLIAFNIVFAKDAVIA